MPQKPKKYSRRKMTRSVQSPQKGHISTMAQTQNKNRQVSGKRAKPIQAMSRHTRQLMTDASVVNRIGMKKGNSTTRWQTAKNLMTIASPSLFIIWALFLLIAGCLLLTALMVKVLSPLLPTQVVSWIVATESQIYHWLLPTQ